MAPLVPHLVVSIGRRLTGTIRASASRCVCCGLLDDLDLDVRAPVDLHVQGPCSLPGLTTTPVNGSIPPMKLSATVEWSTSP
jgi:hypothetical protein